MATEVFRFVTIHPPQSRLVGDSDATVIALDSAEDPFLRQLRAARATGARATVDRVVAEFQATSRFIDSPSKIDPRLRAFAETVSGLPDGGFWNAATNAFSSIVGTTAADYASSDAFTRAFADVAATIVAAAADSRVEAQVRGMLVRTVRGLWLIRRLAASEQLSKDAALAAPILLPDGIFPLPTSTPSTKDEQGPAANDGGIGAAERRERVARLSSGLAAQRRAVTELLSAFETSGPDSAAKQRPAGFLLAQPAVERLSSETKAALEQVGAGGEGVDVAKAVTLLERQAAVLAQQLYTATPMGPLARLGNRLVGADVFVPGRPVAVNPGGGTSVRSPGACPPQPAAPPSNAGVTVPTGHGEARVLGIADLNVVEQLLLRYDLGEIAHIENVLKSESRVRRFKTVDTTQQTDFSSTESTEEKEQDLSSTSRFELQSASQSVISQTASKDAGVTIHASYGPSVDATAHYNGTSSTSNQQSRSASASYAKEITSKAVERVVTRSVTSRTVTTTRQVEDLNRHSFDNSAGTGNVVGVYRYLDKVYSAQIVNYGKRLMLEFVVPEPAAFLRYALTHRPITQITAVNPDPPGYCVDGASFSPLLASDITRDNYLFWASTYGVQDVVAPPSRVVIASASLKSPDQMQNTGDRLLGSDTFDVTIPTGYLTQSAFINIYGETQAGVHQVVVQMQDQQSEYVEPTDDQSTYVLHLLPTPSLGVSVNSLGFYNYEVIVSVFCTLSDEAFQDWQLKTFNSIMKAYENLRDSYAAAVAEAQMRSDVSAVFGANPETNRVTEQVELKKSCISLLTGQRFELFDAMQPNVAPHGYPELDFAEAKAEGAFIQLFEQSFEWNNMTYLFYPYFWARKDEWTTLAQLTDDDPLFAQFLQAGAARVQVPVRLGFEPLVLNYLAIDDLWDAEGTLLTPGGDPAFHLTIIDELKSQTGDTNIDGVGTLNVTHGSTSVTGIQTMFTVDDENRRLVIEGATYIIRSVHDPASIELRPAFAGATAEGLGYALGGKLVGQPWEVKVPTDLVTLDGAPSVT